MEDVPELGQDQDQNNLNFEMTTEQIQKQNMQIQDKTGMDQQSLQE